MKRDTAFKKWIHTSTALVFLFQQISPSFAMEALEEERDFSALRALPAFSPQLPQSLPLPLPLPEELTAAQQTLPSRLEEVRQSLQQTVLESTEAIPDRFSSLIEDIRKTFAEVPTDFRNKVGSKLPNFVKASYSLYPWAFLRDEDELREAPMLTSDHHGFRRVKEVMKVLEELTVDSTIPLTLLSKLQQLQGAYGEYIKTVCSFSLEKRSSFLSPVFLQGDLLEGKSYLVLKSLAYKLLSMGKHGIPEKKNETGSSIVTHVGRIYAKQNLLKERESKPPEGSLNPGMEWAMSTFHHLLIGENVIPGLVPSALLVLSQVPVEGNLSPEKEAEKKQISIDAKNHDTGERDRKEIINRLYEDDTLKSTQNYSLQITPEVEGEFLGTFLEKALKNPEMFDELDKQQVQSLVLSTLLMNPGDAKGDNLMVTKPNAQGKRHIISIDNDLSLASMIIKEGENFHTLETRNILLSIPHLMGQELDQEVREHFQSVNVPAFLLTWLKSLEYHNTEYTGLQRFIDPKTFSLLQFPLKLRKGTGESLVKRFQDFQHHLRLNPHTPITLQSLYEQLYPLPALYIKTLLDQNPDPLKAFDVLYQQGQSIEKALELDKNPDREVKGRRIQGMLDQEHTLKDAYKERTHSIEEVVEEILKAIDFLTLSAQEKVRVLEEASRLFSQVLQRVIVEGTLLKESLGSLFEGRASLNLIALFIEAVPELLTQPDAEGNSLLHRVVQALAPENVISYLIERGISLESENDAYETPLDLAMVYQNGPAFFALVNAGAGKRLQKAQTAETFYKKFALNSTPEVAKYQQAFETLRTRSALIDGMFIRQHFFQNSTQSPIELAEYGPQALSQEAWEQLFDQNGILKPIDPEATRKVGLIDWKGRGLFFKQYPALPGIETAVDVLTLLLFYRGVPYTALANIKGVPYLISEGVGREEVSSVPKSTSQNVPSSRTSRSSTIKSSLSSKLSKSSKNPSPQSSAVHSAFERYKRNNLSYVLKHTPERLTDVDEEFLSEAIIMAMLTGQEDGKPNNFMLQPIPEKPGKYRIVPIDNDQAFVPEVSYPSPNSRQKGKPSRVQVKSVLFCLDHMNRSIHPSVVEVLVHLNPEKLLRRWLEKLSRLTQEHQALFTNPQLNDFWKKNETYIGIPFQRGDIQDVYFKLMKMQDLLKLKPYLTHLELLKEVLPFVHHRYNKIFKNPTLFAQAIHERFLEIDGEAYALKKGSDHHMTLSSSSNILEAKKITVRKTRDEAIVDSEELPPDQWQGELAQAKQAYEDEAKQLLIRKGGAEIAAIMSGQRFKKLKLDLSRRSAYEQSLLFGVLEIRDLEKLTLIHSSELKDSFFERSFPALRELDIRGCPQLTNGVFTLLMKSCPNLRSLNMAKNIALTKVAIIKTLSKDLPITFNDLEVLNISGCPTLQQVRLYAPKFQHFLASNCSQLSEVQLTGAPSLKTLDLRNAQSLSLSTFNSLIQRNQNTLTQVQTEGARNLPPLSKVPIQEIKTPIEGDTLRKFNEHFEKVTENNDPEAQFQLGEMYARGQGIKQHFETALEWYRNAAEKGHDAAKSFCESIRGHEDIYARFLKGRLIYKPNEKNDEGKIELRIADLANPLEGEFDLSKCGDASKYLSINTGYRKGKRPENASKVEIWFVPHFLIEKNLAGSASHFKDIIMDGWDPHTVPVGTFFTRGNWDDLSKFDYATELTWDAYNDVKNNLRTINVQSSIPFRGEWAAQDGRRLGMKNFHVVFN